MKIISFIIIVMFVILACGAPSEAAIGTAIALTQAAENTSISQTQTAIPTATIIPFSSFNLEDLLVIPGDLPPGFTGSQIRSTMDDISKNAPVPDYFISQTFENENNSNLNNIGGLVSVLLYEDISKVEKSYRSILDNMIMANPEDAGFGEKSTASSSSLILLTTDLAFIRCHAVIHVQFLGTFYKPAVISYGQRLDDRLKPLVCR